MYVFFLILKALKMQTKSHIEKGIKEFRTDKYALT